MTVYLSCHIREERVDEQLDAGGDLGRRGLDRGHVVEMAQAQQHEKERLDGGLRLRVVGREEADPHLGPTPVPLREQRRQLRVASTGEVQLGDQAPCLAQLGAQVGGRDRVCRRAIGGSGDQPEATVKAFFLVLLGLCHFDDMGAVKASPAKVAARVELLVDAFFPDVAG